MSDRRRDIDWLRVLAMLVALSFAAIMAFYELLVRPARGAFKPRLIVP